jgi:curved DNA-binding protein CbpA
VPNFYAVLNVPRDADRTTIRASFRTLARQCHPDHGGDLQRMEAIIEAWAVLGHAERRAAYDRTLAVQREILRRPGTAMTVDTLATQVRRPDTLGYGRYAGWTIEALADQDPDYLEWLRRSPGGRVWWKRIEVALADRAARMPVRPPPVRRRTRLWRLSRA